MWQRLCPVSRYVLTIPVISVKILPKCDETSLTVTRIAVRAASHLTIFMRGQLETGKIQRNNYHHGSCGRSLTGKTSSVSLIFTHRTHRNVKNR